MPKAIESIQTRQRAEPLFGSNIPLGAGGSVLTPNNDGSLVAGFNAVTFFAVSDQPFQIQVFEGCHPGGPMAVTETLLSALVDGRHTICERILPCGQKIKSLLTNLGGPQTFLSFCASGLPEP